jgi:hypothetical protein
MPRSIIIPVTNVYAKGDYTAKIKIGSKGATANLILDTGSSALVVQGEDYQPAEEEHIKAPDVAQNVTAGMGGGFGPVVKTTVAMGDGPFSVSMEETTIAVTRKEMAGCFGKADGILGLAYYELSKAYELTEYLDENNVEPAVTYPWFLAEEQQDDTVREFKKFLRNYPLTRIKPYFTRLEEQGVVGNQFALLIHRSSIYQTSKQKTFDQLKRHPLNNGVFIMGHPSFHKHLYKGIFKKVKVLHNKYYNVNVKSLQVGNYKAIQAPQLAKKHKNYRTNGIVDTGASGIALPKVLFDQMISDLVKHNSEFDSILEPYRTFEGVEEGVDIGLIDLEIWPTISITLEGLDGEDVKLDLDPLNYWQVHAPKPNQASFQFVFLENWPNQCILGLPLMTAYFTIFDREVQDKGVILFAEKPDLFNS